MRVVQALGHRFDESTSAWIIGLQVMHLHVHTKDDVAKYMQQCCQVECTIEAVDVLPSHYVNMPE